MCLRHHHAGSNWPQTPESLPDRELVSLPAATGRCVTPCLRQNRTWGHYLSYQQPQNSPPASVSPGMLPDHCRTAPGFFWPGWREPLRQAGFAQGHSGGREDRNACGTWSQKTQQCCCPGAGPSAVVSCYRRTATRSCRVSSRLLGRWQQHRLGATGGGCTQQPFFQAVCQTGGVPGPRQILSEEENLSIKRIISF